MRSVWNASFSNTARRWSRLIALVRNPAPENSVAALRLSIAAGADFAEIDVQQTSDGEVVLMHDRDLRRMTGDPREVKDISAADLASLHIETLAR